MRNAQCAEKGTRRIKGILQNSELRGEGNTVIGLRKMEVCIFILDFSTPKMIRWRSDAVSIHIFEKLANYWDRQTVLQRFDG
jgi:hypothetical protein